MLAVLTWFTIDLNLQSIGLTGSGYPNMKIRNLKLCRKVINKKILFSCPVIVAVASRFGAGVGTVIVKQAARRTVTITPAAVRQQQATAAVVRAAHVGFFEMKSTGEIRKIIAVDRKSVV